MTKQPRLLKLGELLGKWNIRRSIKDRELRRKLTPNYRAGCKRILNSDTYYRGIANPKTEVITDGIARFTTTGIVAADGTEREVDVVVFATGFHVTDSYTYVDIKGRARRGPGRPVEPRGHRRAARHHRRRHAEPVLPARPEHRPRPQLGGVHDRVADPLRRPGDRRGGQEGRPGAGADAGGPGRATTRSCSTTWPARCGAPAAAAAGTWTSTASTGRCGAA